MPIIRILDDFTIKQIAAGEVVERPASVVKELVENSIDANSTAITIEIQNGGISLIRVTDNGDGMGKEDAKQAFQNHATSKISSVSDLQSIRSLGFRGEALASISSVTQLELFTRRKDDLSGTHIINHGGDLISIQEIGCPEGTTIIMRNLFYNTPARLKFLKSTRAETAYISELIGKLILANPAISFRFINQDKTIYHSPGNNSLLSSICCIYGENVHTQLLKIDKEDKPNNLSIYGYLGAPSLSRTNRSFQSLFINGRYVKSSLLSKSIENAYQPFLMGNHFPWIVLHLNFPQSKIDVNVHPSKTEVRFNDEEVIYTILNNWIREALDSTPYIPVIEQNNLNPLDFPKEESDKTLSDSYKSKDKEKTLLIKDKEKTEQIYEIEQEGIDGKTYDYTSNNIISQRNNTIQHEYDYAGEILAQDNLKIIGRVFSTYILVEGNDKLFFIDQHAAHERLIYERLKNTNLEQKNAIQQLLPPIVIEVTYDEQIALNDSIELFNSIGFEIEQFGDRTFIIRGVPMLLATDNINEFFRGLMDQLREYWEHSKKLVINYEDIVTMACKKAVKARDPLSEQEILSLVENINSGKFPMTCPHGRPIVVSITKYELEKKFKRVE